jgi:hypothetical protein
VIFLTAKFINNQVSVQDKHGTIDKLQSKCDAYRRNIKKSINTLIYAPSNRGLPLTPIKNQSQHLNQSRTHTFCDFVAH